MKPSPSPDWPSRSAALWLLSVVATWPWPGVSEALLSLGAIFALVAMLWRRYSLAWPLASREAWALCTALFLAYWLPECLSAIDADVGAPSAREALLDLRYLPFLLAVAIAVATPVARRWTQAGLALIVALWTLDGLAQATWGWSLRGAGGADRLSGIFGVGNLKLGLVLASLSPFALSAAAARGRIVWLLAAALLGWVILLAGARAAWLTYALVLLWSGRSLFGSRAALAGLALAALVALLALRFGPEQLSARYERSAAVLAGDEAGLDQALSGRVSIWKAAWRMGLAHPVNGVGVRDFRRHYRDYADTDDFFLSRGQGGALHAHQVLLEVFSETGAIGLLCWFAGAGLAWRAWRWAPMAWRDRARVPALALAVTVFPFNTHLAFYSNFWGGVLMLLLGLFAGQLMARDEHGSSPA